MRLQASGYSISGTHHDNLVRSQVRKRSVLMRS